MTALLVALAIVAGVLAVVELFRSRLGNLLAWGVFAPATVSTLLAGRKPRD